MESKTRKLHFSSVIENTFASTWIIFVIIIGNLTGSIIDIVEQGAGFQEIIYASLGTVGLILAIFGFFTFKWLKTTVTLNNDTVVIDQNTIQRKTKTIALQNISTVDIEQNLFERLINTAKVKIDTYTAASGAQESDIKIILKKDEAIKFQNEILNKVKGEFRATENILLDEYDFKFDLSTMIKHALIATNIPVLILLAIIYIPMLIFGTFAAGFNTTTLLGIGIIVVPFIYSTIMNISNLYDFKIKREKEELLISYGYFTKKKHTIPFEKITGIKVVQSLIGRMIGKYSIEVISVGMGVENKTISIILPYLSKQEIEQKLKVLLEDVNINIKPEKQTGKTLIPIISDFSFMIIATILIAFFTIKLLIIPILIFWLVIITFTYLTKTIYISDKTLYIENGLFAKNQVIVNMEKIEFLTVKQKPFGNLVNKQKLNINMLANATNIAQQTGYFDKQYIDKIVEEYQKA